MRNIVHICYFIMLALLISTLLSCGTQGRCDGVYHPAHANKGY